MRKGRTQRAQDKAIGQHAERALDGVLHLTATYTHQTRGPLGGTREVVATKLQIKPLAQVCAPGLSAGV